MYVVKIIIECEQYVIFIDIDISNYCENASVNERSLPKYLK